MDENYPAYGIEISDSDWEKTPANIKQLVEKMRQDIKQSEERLANQPFQGLVISPKP
jgi:transposase